MRRGTISCFERGALNLRGNRRLFLTLLLKSLLSMVVAVATMVPALKILGLGDLYLQSLSGRPEALVDALPDWISMQQLPSGLPWAVAILVLGGVVQALIQTFLDGGALGTLASGDRQAPADTPVAEGQELTADWFETFNWREFFGWGGQLVWRLLTWRIPVAAILAVLSVLPFLLMAMAFGGWQGTGGVALAAGCFGGLVILVLVSLLWLWWWVVEMHLSFLPLSLAVRRGSQSFIRRGGSWMLLTGIGFLLLIAAMVPVFLLSWSMQMVSSSGLVAVIFAQVVSGVLQALVLGAVVLLMWGAAIALARNSGKPGEPAVGATTVESSRL